MGGTLTMALDVPFQNTLIKGGKCINLAGPTILCLNFFLHIVHHLNLFGRKRVSFFRQVDAKFGISHNVSMLMNLDFGQVFASRTSKITLSSWS
jgi:hypothetical protein